MFCRKGDAERSQGIICCELFTYFCQFLNPHEGSVEGRKKKIQAYAKQNSIKSQRSLQGRWTSMPGESKQMELFTI